MGDLAEVAGLRFAGKCLPFECPCICRTPEHLDLILKSLPRALFPWHTSLETSRLSSDLAF
eukprot:7485204-Karenia_brevis.AAC.1